MNTRTVKDLEHEGIGIRTSPRRRLDIRVPLLYYATGGADNRNLAFIACEPRGRMICTIYTCLEWGGPLDAPEIMPAGGMNSTEYTNWQGEAVPMQSNFSRELGFAPSK